MTTVILLVLGILIAAVAALMMFFYGGDAYNESQAKADAARLVTEGGQLESAVSLYQIQEGKLPGDGVGLDDKAMQDMISKQYLTHRPPGNKDKDGNPRIWTVDYDMGIIRSTVGVVQWPDWCAARRVADVPVRYAYRFDRAFMALDAAVQGLGVALESTAIGEPHLRKGRLRPVFETGEHLTVQAHFLVYPQRHARRPEVMNFVDWVLARAGAPAMSR